MLVLAERPLAALLGALALNLVLAGIGVAAGLVLVGDQAKYFRELAPGTWLSWGQLLLIAATVWAVRTRADRDVPWWRSFWGLSAVFFVLFAFDEITQFTIFAADALERGFGARPSAGFHDVQAVLLTMLFTAAALILLPRALVLLRHPLGLALLGAGAALGAASQALDSFGPATRWEFVAEETLKLGAEAFLLGGFLVVLRDVLARTVRRDSSAARVSQAA